MPCREEGHQAPRTLLQSKEGTLPLALEIGTENDAFRHPTGTGAYEWWYFDAYDPVRDLGCVIIFFEGVPFSGFRQRSAAKAGKRGYVDRAADFPAVSFSLYHRGRTVAYMANLHGPERFEAGTSPVGVTIGKNRAMFDGGSYQVELDDVLLDGRALSARFSFVPQALPSIASDHSLKDSADAAHQWILAAPRCRVSGTIRLGADERHEISGNGYHDHNIGESSLQAQFESWEWGRVSFRNRTMVYYRATGAGGEQRAWLLDVAEADLSIAPAVIHESMPLRNVYKLGYPGRMIVSAGPHELEVRQRRIVDNGPFYLRFISEFVLDRECVSGFSEVLRPKALAWRWFWPMLNSRVRRVDSGDRVGRKITNWLVGRGY